MWESCLIRSEEALAESTPEGFIVMTGTGEMYRFNGVAEYVWARCDGAHTLRALVDGIMREFEAPSVAEVERDVLAFARFLLERGLVSAGPAGGGAAEEGFPWLG
ncbi:MAG: PqqD family protein [Bacillota bacterium]